MVLFLVLMILFVFQLWLAAVINVFSGLKGPEQLGVKRTVLYCFLPYAIYGARHGKDRVTRES